jgi:hypothetical protein
MTFTDILVPTYTSLLGALSAWLGKAEAPLVARLAPDMFPLATQIRFACVQAREGMLRLHGQAFPPELTDLLNEGRVSIQSCPLPQTSARIALEAPADCCHILEL